MAAEEKRKFEQLELNSDIFAFQAVENHIDLKRMIGNAASTLQAAVLHHNIEPDDEEKGRTLLMVKGKSTQGLDCILLKNGVFTIIYEWEKAKKGDCFYMERLGDEGRGIVFRGQFTSDPYLGEDWAGTSKKRYYVDIDCFDASPADGQPHITVEELKSILPEINWDKGHSGQLLTESQAQKLDELWDSKMEDRKNND
mgnify:CR=1 FL=1